MTVCVPCNDAGRPNVPAIRFIPLNGESVPMCDNCFGNGMGPAMNWKPPQELGRKPPKPAAVTRPPGIIPPRPPAPSPEPAPMKSPTVQDLLADRSKGEPVHNIDWVKVQNRRSGGEDVPSIAKSLGVSTFTVYAHTKTPPKAEDRRSAAPPKPKAASPRNGTRASADSQTVDQLIAKLEQKRAAIDSAIESLKDARTLLAED